MGRTVVVLAENLLSMGMPEKQMCAILAFRPYVPF